MNIEVFYCEGVLELWDSRLIISAVLIRYNCIPFVEVFLIPIYSK